MYVKFVSGEHEDLSSDRQHPEYGSRIESQH